MEILDVDLVEKIYGLGCDDALVGERHGVKYADFDHMASTLYEGIMSAVHDLESADARLGVYRVEPDEEEVIVGTTTNPTIRSAPLA